MTHPRKKRMTAKQNTERLFLADIQEAKRSEAIARKWFERMRDLSNKAEDEMKLATFIVRQLAAQARNLGSKSE